MKKLLIVGVLILILSGCGTQETFETVGAGPQSTLKSDPWELVFDMPLDAGTPVVESKENGTLYICNDYTMTQQTMPGGDLDRTLVECTGFAKDKLQIMHTKGDGVKRYESVWTAVAEDCDQIGRILVLDDGKYHYVLTVMADAEKAGELTETWQMLFRSAHLVDPETLVNTGS